MARQSDKRERLVAAADQLFHLRGYERSSIADVAAQAGVPAGNVYYYFKTKDEIAQAVIAARKAEGLRHLAELDKLGNPIDILTAYVDYHEDHRKERAKDGCAVGALCQEANKIGGPLAETASTGFQIYLDWLQTHFRDLGQSEKTARANATHLFGSLEGAILLAQSLREPKLVKSECKRLKAWLAEMGAEAEPYDPTDIPADALPS